jgi:hypothetical protein
VSNPSEEETIMIDHTAPVGRVLSGEFGSPAEVLAASHLEDDEKAAILNQWLQDLRHLDSSNEDIVALRSSINNALAGLGKTE